MEFKNALAVCLISLFSATLVVLIARSLDLQAAARVEPQLERIAEQLELIRQQGLAATPAAPATDTSVRDGLIVYYFHGNVRCDTCRTIESQTLAALQSKFQQQLQTGQIVWKVHNYEAATPAIAEMAKMFEIQIPNVVLARMSGGQIENWKRLDKVWALFDDQPAFTELIQSEVDQMLSASVDVKG